MQKITAQLIKECKKQISKSQEQLYNIMYNDVYNLSYRHTSSKEDALEITQKAFIRIFTKIKQYKGKGEKENKNITEEKKFRAWAMRIVRNIIL